MNPKIRKIIAREWFVIILVIQAVILTITIGTIKFNIIYNNAAQIEQQYSIKYSEDGKISSVNGKALSTEDDFKMLSDEEFKAIKDSMKLGSRAFDIDNNTNLIIIVLITGYFIYLLIRCVIWKVKKRKLGEIVSIKQGQDKQEEDKVRYYANPEFIYIFLFLFSFLALPLAWVTPYMEKRRKILLSLVIIFFTILKTSYKYYGGVGIILYIMVLAWFYKTDRYIIDKNKQTS